jgi:hypothetical protein
MDFGMSYELGRWHLGKKPNSPAVTVEAFAGARWLIDEIKIKISPGGPFHPGAQPGAGAPVDPQGVDPAPLLHV